MNNCPCFSGKLYQDCCKKLHEGVPANDALELMRSRYAAYALKLPDYIIETTHPDHPHHHLDKKKWKEEILTFSEATSFDGLEILDFQSGDKDATVTFTAVLHQNRQNASFTEKSAFQKVSGQWLYKSGEFIR